MPGYFSIVLHAHLPFVRHPEHEKFLEENWLFEAITETYLPLLRKIRAWELDGLDARLTLTLSPTLCAMLLDSLLQERYVRHLTGLIELAEKEIDRTHFDHALNPLSRMYHRHFSETRDQYFALNRNLVAEFAELQARGWIEIITSAATHALLPLLVSHPPSLRAQILVARDHYRSCFGCDPRGIWLPECAYVEQVEAPLREGNFRWFVSDTHGLANASPRPRFGVFAPIYTPNGLAVFARDQECSRQVWSRTEGYPGDPRYRDFYRDVGFDLEFDYVRPHLPAQDVRSFTGIKYFRITGQTADKQVYEPAAALQAATGHAKHFFEARLEQFKNIAPLLNRAPLVLAPYDAELFGHWWHEGPDFLDLFIREACRASDNFALVTPGEYLRRHPTNQVSRPAASSWGEDGYWGVWLNEKNQWIYPHLNVAQDRMTELVRQFSMPTLLQSSALRQAARELMLAQSSDWPFILRTGTSPEYARGRFTDHLLRFTKIYEQLVAGTLDEARLVEVESRDNLFPEINLGYWA